MQNSPTSFSFSRVMSGWWWLLDRDGLRIARFAAFWVLVKFALYSLDHMMGLNQGLGLATTTFFVDPFFVGVLYLVALSDDGRGPMQMTSEASGRYLALLGLIILTSLGMMLGFLLLVLPGIALAILWSIAVPVLLAEQKGPIDAMRTSFDLVKSQFWPVFGVFCVFGVGAIAVIAVVAFFDLTNVTGAPGPLLALDSLIEVITSIVGIYLATAIYREFGFGGRHDVTVFD